MVFLENGEIARTVNEATARWRRHYAAMEGGTETSPMDLWQDDIRTRPAPPTTIDLKNVATPEQWDAFYQHWPDIPWTTPPTIHADILNREIQQRLAEHFPIDRNRTRRGIIFSSSTWRIHAERGRIRKILTAHGKAYISLRLHCALRLWTSGLSQKQVNIKMISYALKIAATYILHGQVQRDLRRFLDHDRAQYL